MKKVVILVAALMLPVIGSAIDQGRAFDDPELQQRYEKIISEVRCLKCQNQTIKDSNAFLAADLRREIRRLLSEGKTDAEVYDFLVFRYGEFALYRPKMSGKTLILWLAPVILLLVGGFVIIRVMRERMKLPLQDEQETEQN
jgi:cytochrome c-type biogenesis protein CcmH